jgi:L-amino acid N-acyltransferase YncA
MPIRALHESDWNAVKDIYIQGIQTGMATFETEVPDWSDWIAARIPGSSFVLEHNGDVLGWATLSPYSSRCVYQGVGEVSIYIHEDARGKGYGKELLKHLIEQSEALGIWTLQAGIFPENKGSIHLHKLFGFREMGTSEKLGTLNGVWKDVVHLERRSDKIFA